MGLDLCAVAAPANAGIQAYGPLANTSEEDWNNVIDINVKGTANTVRAALPHREEVAVFRNNAPFLPSHPFLLSKTRLAREFETCQGRRRRVDIFRKRQHLESPAEHFRVEQRL